MGPHTALRAEEAFALDAFEFSQRVGKKSVIARAHLRVYCAGSHHLGKVVNYDDSQFFVFRSESIRRGATVMVPT